MSSLFDLPSWQNGLSATRTGGQHAALSRRGVSDVAGDALSLTGYDVLIDGEQMVIGGTSAVAPLWAALVVRINAINKSPSGFLNAKLYNAKSACNDITLGQQRQLRGIERLGRLHRFRQPECGTKVAAALTAASKAASTAAPAKNPQKQS